MKPKPPLTQHRLARLTAWTKLWLQAFAAALPFLLHLEPQRTRQRLARIARFVGALVFLHVAARYAPPKRKSWRKPVQHAGLLRALVGVRLRRKLRARDPVERFFAILSVMRDLGLEADRLQRRLARGLTRLRVIAPAREHAAPALAMLCATPHAADTS